MTKPKISWTPWRVSKTITTPKTGKSVLVRTGTDLDGGLYVDWKHPDGTRKRAHRGRR